MVETIYYKHPHVLKAIKHVVLPFLFYFLTFFLLTYPLIIKFSTHYFADAGDGLQNVWNLWWVNSAVLRPNLYPSIWQTNMLHWPFGTTLYGQTLNPFNGFLAVFLFRFLPPTATYNTIVIFGFVMGGITMYWLSYYLTRSFWGSILAGFIFTFSSYHFSHAGPHLQLTSLEWIPLFILLWYILITKPDTLSAIGAAISLWMVILCDYYYFFYCVLTAIIIVIWCAFRNKSLWFIVSREYFPPLLTFVVAELLLAGPIVSSLLIINYRDPLLGSHESDIFSLDLLALVIPGGHWFFNQWTQFYWSKLPGLIEESSVYLGLSVYILITYAWIKRRTLDLILEQQIYLWSIIMGFFFLLALGPVLHIEGKAVWDKLMPYTLLLKGLPILSLGGVPVRMTVMVIFSASVLSAIGFRELLRKFPIKKGFIFVLLSMLIFETLPKPFVTTRVVVPEYVQSLAALPNDGGLVDLIASDKSLSLYYQTIHNKPLVFGYVSRLPTSVYKKNKVLIETINNRDYGKLWVIYHIRYIITHDIIQDQDVQSYLTIELVYDKDNIRIYRIGCECEGNKK